MPAPSMKPPRWWQLPDFAMDQRLALPVMNHDYWILAISAKGTNNFFTAAYATLSLRWQGTDIQLIRASFNVAFTTSQYLTIAPLGYDTGITGNNGWGAASLPQDGYHVPANNTPQLWYLSGNSASTVTEVLALIAEEEA